MAPQLSVPADLSEADLSALAVVAHASAAGMAIPVRLRRVTGSRTAMATICPDPAALDVGDVLLFSDHKQGAGGAAIVEFQNAVFGDGHEAAEWTHVGIYAGEGMFWDNNPGENIRKRTLSSALTQGRRMGAARPMGLRPDPAVVERECAFLQGTTQYRIVAAETLRKLASRLRPARRLRRESQVAGHLICSSFAMAVLEQATGGRFHMDVEFPIPGDFAVDPALERLDLCWCRTELA